MYYIPCVLRTGSLAKLVQTVTILRVLIITACSQRNAEQTDQLILVVCDVVPAGKAKMDARKCVESQDRLRHLVSYLETSHYSL